MLPAPTLLLSETGHQRLRLAADTAVSSHGTADLLQQVAQQGEVLRALLDQLSRDLATGDVTAVQAHLDTVLTPARRLDEAYDRFRNAQRIAQTTHASFQVADGERNQYLSGTQLRQLHATASAVAAAFDELAMCAQAWADLIEA